MQWAADGRQRSEWLRAASLTAAAIYHPPGSAVDPADLVPDRYRPDAQQQEARTPASEALESEIAWRLLEQGLKSLGG